jgi:hypothetical protein
MAQELEADEKRTMPRQGGAVQSGTCKPDGLVRVRQTYEPLGVSDEIIEHIAKVEGARDILLSPRCDTPDKKAMSEKLLSYATGELLGVLAAEMGTPINVITLIAKSARRIAPAAFDRWVDFQLSNGLSLGMIATVRNPTDLPRERSVEEQLAEGKLAFGSVTPVLARLVSFVGILRPKLESDLGVKTAADHLELDSALDTYLTARRIAGHRSTEDFPIGHGQTTEAEACPPTGQATS